VDKGKAPSGPSGYQEVGCATVSYYDRFGERLVTRRMARMPEANKATLKRQLTAEVMGALIQRPDLRVVKVADGPADNWTYLSETLPVGEAVLDFYHAVDHLSDALGAAYGEGTLTYQARLATLREVLRDDRKASTESSRRWVVCGAVTRVARRFIRQLHIFVSIGIGCAIAACEPSFSQSDPVWLKPRAKPW
jgi:hypothetical protein